MVFPLLVAATTVLFLAMVGVSLLLFGREWLQSVREARFSRALGRHEALVSHLRTTGPENFERAFRQLAAIPDAALQEAILDRAREGSPEEADAFFVKAYEDLAITERYLEAVERSPNWEARARAAERLGRLGSATAVPVLLRVIENTKDEDEDVRGAALRALGRIRDPRALPGLIAALGYPEASLPPRIAEIIIMFGAEAVRLLIAELRNLDSDVRRMWAAEILGWVRDSRAVVPLIEALGDVSPEVRAKAAGALARLVDSRALERLLEMLLSDPVPFVRTRVAQALGAIGHPKVIDHLIHVLKDPEWWVRIRAIEALEQIGQSAVGALLVALEDEDAEVRRRAAMGLERMGYVQDSIGKLESEGFRPDLFRILSSVGKAGVTEVLFGGIQAAGERARKLLVRIAGEIGDPSAGPLLASILAKSRDPSLRSRIVEALGKVGHREAIPDILPCLRDSDRWVRRAAVGALCLLGADEHVEELVRLLRDPAADTRVAVCRVVSSLEGRKGEAAVEELLADPSPKVRVEALRVVKRREIRACEPKARELLGDVFEEVRVEAAMALSSVGTAESIDAILSGGRGASERLVDALTAALSRSHRGPFAELLSRAPDNLGREQVLVLLGAASQGADGDSLAFVSGYLGAPDPSHRRWATFALRAFAAHEVLPLLEKAVRDPDGQVREAAVTVAALDGGEPCLSLVEGLAADPCEGVRFHVAAALAGSRGGGSRETLLVLGRDRVSSVRAAAAMALALRNDPNLVSVLRDFFRDEELCSKARELFVSDSSNVLVARMVERALRQKRMETRLFLPGSRFALEKELMERAREALTSEERLRALELCKVVATGQSYTAALSILKNDPAPELRTGALELLLSLRRDSEVASVVGSALMDPYPPIRARAAHMLGEMEFPEAMEALVHALDTPDRKLREAVTTSLANHMARSPEGVAKLMKEIPTTKMRKLGLVWLLGKSRRGGAMRLLLRFLEDEDADVRASAVGALAKYRIGIVGRFLKGSLSDPNGRVRAAAVNAVSRMQTREWEEVVERMLADPDSFVRQRAAIALHRMGSKGVRKRIQSFREEPEELRPVWAAVGLIRGELHPSEVLAYPAAARFLEELFPADAAEAAVRESPEAERRRTAFRVLQILSPPLAERASRELARDPDADLRREAAASIVREPDRR